MPKDQIAALSLLCFASNEANILQRSYLVTSRYDTDDEFVKTMATSQRFLLLRYWSARIYEVADFMKLKGHNSTTDQQLRDLCRAAMEEFSQRGLENQLSVARNIRNEVSAHNSLKAVRKNVDHLADDAELSFYVNDAEGNSFYLLGDEVVFSARLNREYANSLDRQSDLDNWFRWNLDSNDWMKKTTADFAGEILFKRFDGRKWEDKDCWLDDNWVGDLHSHLAPFFHEKAND